MRPARRTPAPGRAVRGDRVGDEGDLGGDQLDAVVLYPVLRPLNDVLAVGSLILRGAVETACYLLSAISCLLLLTLGEAVAAGPGTASPTGTSGQAVGGPCRCRRVTALVFCLGGVIFSLLLCRSRIAPR